MTCVFGIMFVLIGTAAMNAMSFGIRVLEAAGRTPDNFTVRGIAIAVTTFAVVLHGTWRQAGLLLNTGFAIFKILMLLLIIITGFIALGGGFSHDHAASRNFNVDHAFQNTANDPYGFAESFLAVLFAYSGFNQANYVSVGGAVESRWGPNDDVRSLARLIIPGRSISGQHFGR